MDKYEVIGSLGEGSFGRVYKAKQLSDGCLVALKVISKRGRSTKELKGFRRECEIQRDLHHPNIIQMLDSFETENEIVVITEFAHKELTSVLSKEGYLSEASVQPIVWDLVSALYYLHSNRVLHRDLKPQNILLDIDNHAKLCDFGFARNMSTGTHVLTSIKGTPLYMAPELIDEQPYDYNADLWSLGCIIYELLMGTPPFCTASILHLIRLIRHEQIVWPTSLSDSCISFLKGLLQKSPAKRMTWEEILSHPFVKGHIILSKDTACMPLTKHLSTNTLQLKEQQKKKHNKASSSKNSDINDRSSEQRKSSNVKSSKTSQNSNKDSTKSSNGRDVKKNLCENMQNLSLDNKDKDVSASKTSDSNQTGLQKSNDTTFQNKDKVHINSNKNKGYVEKEDYLKKNGKDLKEKLSFIEDNHPIEIDEWMVFLHKLIWEALRNDFSTLMQTNQVNMIVSLLRNTNANPDVLVTVAKLFSTPLAIPDVNEETLNQIKKVYFEAKLVPNLLYALKLLVRKYQPPTTSDDSSSLDNFSPQPGHNGNASWEISDEDMEAFESAFLLISYLTHSSNEFLLHFCDAVAVLNFYTIFKVMLLSKNWPTIILDLLAILSHVLRKCPENSEIVENILTSQTNDPNMKEINFVDMLRKSDHCMRKRTCYFLLFAGKCLSKEVMKAFWNDEVTDTLEALMYDSRKSVRNVAEVAVTELKKKEYYMSFK